MKIIIAFAIFSNSLFGQSTVVPFVDFNNWFRCVENEEFKYIELQQIKSYEAGDNLVAYLDIRGNLKVYANGVKTELSNQNLNYKISDNLLAWNIGTTLLMWDGTTKKALNYFAGEYIVKDNLVIYLDTRYNTITAHVNGRDYPLQTATTTLSLTNSAKIGENILAYADNGNIFRIFYEGNTYEVGVWYGDIDFQSGTDIVAFNDPTTRTFAVFDKGAFVDVEQQWVRKYRSGRGFIVYEDVNNNLMLYQNGEKTQLSSFPGNWEVKDDIVVYENNGFTYTWVNGITTMAANYRLEEYKVKNGTLVFTTMIGGVSAVVNGKVVELTNLQNSEYEIYGNSILVKLMNSSYIIYQNDKLLRV